MREGCYKRLLLTRLSVLMTGSLFFHFWLSKAWSSLRRDFCFPCGKGLGGGDGAEGVWNSSSLDSPFSVRGNSCAGDGKPWNGEPDVERGGRPSAGLGWCVVPLP